MSPRHAHLPLWQDKTPAEKLDALRDLLLELYGFQFREARAQVLMLLAAHTPADDKEARDMQRIKSLVAAHPNIFCAHCEVGHITASAAIVDPDQKRALLHYHKRLGRWLQVGGHAEYETGFAAVALREAREETGLPDLAHIPPSDAPAPVDYDVHTIPQRGDMPEHLHLDLRYVLATHQPDALAPSKGESTRFRWLSYSDVLNMDLEIDDSLRRLLRKAFALVRPAAAE